MADAKSAAGQVGIDFTKTNSYVKKNKVDGKRYIPQVAVSFHTDDACYQVKGANVPMGTVPDPSFQVVSVTTQKMLSTPAGGFSITLVGDEWTKANVNGKPGKKLRPNDLVVIKMGYKPTLEDKAKKAVKMHTVMVGLIDRVQRNRQIGGTNGSGLVTTTITGRDFGKVLLKSMLKFYPSIGLKSNAKNDDGTDKTYFLTKESWSTFMTTFLPANQKLINSPAILLDRMMRYILRKLYDTTWSVWDDATGTNKKDAKLSQILRYQFASTSYFVPFNLSLDGQEGSLWNLMERANIKPMTELFVDTRSEAEIDGKDGQFVDSISEQSSEAKAKPDATDMASATNETDKKKVEEAIWLSPAIQFGEDKAKVIFGLRNTPFTEELWGKLKTHELTDVDVTGENLSYSDDEHFNLFYAGSSTIQSVMSVEQQKNIFPPEINTDDAKRYGLSPLEIDIKGIFVDSKSTTLEKDKTQFVVFAEKVAKLLKAWYEKNHEYWCGNIMVRGKGDYRVGQRLLYKNLDIDDKKALADYDFYLEGVQQNFHMYTDWQTILTVTRGFNAANRFKK